MFDDPVETDEERAAAGRMNAGVAAGTLGGVLLILFIAVVSAVRGDSFWMPFKAIAAFFGGSDALTSGMGMMAVGVITHLVMSAIFGIVFAYIVPREEVSPLAMLLYGVSYGLALLLVMTFLFLPWADPTLRDEVVVRMPEAWLIAHVLFGVGVAFTPAFLLRRAGRRAPSPRTER